MRFFLVPCGNFTNRQEVNSCRFKVLPAAKRLYAHPARDPEGSFKRLANWLDASFYFFPSNLIPPPQNPGVTRIFSITEGPAPEKRPLFRGHGSKSSLVFRSKRNCTNRQEINSYWLLFPCAGNIIKCNIFSQNQIREELYPNGRRRSKLQT